MTFSHGLKFKMIDKISLSTMYVLAINGMKISMCFTDVIIISYAKNKILSTSKWTNGTLAALSLFQRITTYVDWVRVQRGCMSEGVLSLQMLWTCIFLKTVS